MHIISELFKLKISLVIKECPEEILIQHILAETLLLQDLMLNILAIQI